MDDKRHLYNKAKITLNQAHKALDNKAWCAYRTYVDGYNELLAKTPQICGDEVYRYMGSAELSRRVSAYSDGGRGHVYVNRGKQTKRINGIPAR